MILIDEEQRRIIGECGEASYPHECCGFLIGREDQSGVLHVDRVVPASNVHDADHGCRYLVSPHELLEMERQARESGLKILGYFHSHPDADAHPSEYDRQNAWPQYIYFIVSVRQGRARDLSAWRWLEDRCEFLVEAIS